MASRSADSARPTARMGLEVALGREPIEGDLSLDRELGPDAMRWSFVGWVAFVRALEEAIVAAERRIEADTGAERFRAPDRATDG